MEDMSKVITKLKTIKEVKTMFIDSVKEHVQKIEQTGRRKEKIDAARKMLAKGAEMDFIVDVSGLTIEEIEKLKQN